MLAAVGRRSRLLLADDEERLDVVVGEELVAVAAAPRLHLEGVVQVLQGGPRYVNASGINIRVWSKSRAQKFSRFGAAFLYTVRQESGS